MIEGVRLLPWLELAAREGKDNVAHLQNCEQCMKERSVTARQELGCAYEAPSRFATPWRHRGYTEEPPTVCPGYTTRLPEVIETARGYWHSERHSWRDFTGGEAHEHLLLTIEVFGGQAASAREWAMRPDGEK